MKYDLRVMGFGGGNDSSGLLLAYLTGDLKKWLPDHDIELDCAIFADTGWEPVSVYKHLQYIKTVAAGYGFPIFTVKVGDIRQDMQDIIMDAENAHLSTPPMFIRKEDGEVSMLTRRCTSDYKTTAIRRKIRDLLGGSVTGRKVQQWFGITADEIQRLKMPDVKYIDHYYPLVDANKTKWDIRMWTVNNGFNQAPKSACLCCPFHSDEYWSELKKNSPDEFEEVCKVEDDLKNKVPGVKHTAYFHRSCKSLREVNFEDPDQTTLFDMVEECGGYCGV